MVYVVYYILYCKGKCVNTNEVKKAFTTATQSSVVRMLGLMRMHILKQEGSRPEVKDSCDLAI